MDKEFIISEEYINIRLDKVLSLLDNSISRTQIDKLITDNKILVNGKIVKSSYNVKLNDKIVVEYEENYDTSIEPENIKLDIRYEDNDLLVINKPAGMVVHPANGHYSNTLVNALLYHFKSLSTLSGENRPGIVHRLDKETSGLLMVAKNNYTHEKLSLQLKNKSAFRRYIALISGELPHSSGKIIAPIGRSKIDRKKMMVNSNGKDATTNFNVLERFNGYTLVECILETGRTHQIRVHFSTIKFPIVGDIIYGPKKPLFDHMLLHAETLSFIHPRTNARISVSCELPKYFTEALENLRKYGKLYKEN